MRLHSQWLKLCILSLSLMFCFSYGLNVYAQSDKCSGPGCLRVIAENTYGVFDRMNGLPGYLVQATEALISLIAPDESDSTTQIQSNFTTLGNQFINNNNRQNDPASLLEMNAMAFGMNPSDFQPGGNPVTGGVAVMATKPFNPNDLTYSTLLGLPPLQKGGVNPKEYTKYASGMNIKHVMPDFAWKPQGGAAYERYLNYYNTILSVETFNGYVLNSLVAESENGNQQINLQNTLISQATDPNKWFKIISAQKIGVVLRQILLYQSQIYVLLSQMVLVQKQMLTAQVMTNTLLITANQDRENIMAKQAQALPLTP